VSLRGPLDTMPGARVFYMRCFFWMASLATPGLGQSDRMQPAVSGVGAPVRRPMPGVMKLIGRTRV